eukprot:m.288675 g.288675  ORF g.288675 m.288675 type:complete len:432 (-) comp12013_c0_seq1:832-2127(-)
MKADKQGGAWSQGQKRQTPVRASRALLEYAHPPLVQKRLARGHRLNCKVPSLMRKRRELCQNLAQLGAHQLEVWRNRIQGRLEVGLELLANVACSSSSGLKSWLGVCIGSSQVRLGQTNNALELGGIWLHNGVEAVDALKDLVLLKVAADWRRLRKVFAVGAAEQVRAQDDGQKHKADGRNHKWKGHERRTGVGRSKDGVAEMIAALKRLKKRLLGLRVLDSSALLRVESLDFLQHVRDGLGLMLNGAIGLVDGLGHKDQDVDARWHKLVLRISSRQDSTAADIARKAHRHGVEKWVLRGLVGDRGKVEQRVKHLDAALRERNLPKAWKRLSQNRRTLFRAMECRGKGQLDDVPKLLGREQQAPTLAVLGRRKQRAGQYALDLLLGNVLGKEALQMADGVVPDVVADLAVHGNRKKEAFPGTQEADGCAVD